MAGDGPDDDGRGDSPGGVGFKTLGDAAGFALGVLVSCGYTPDQILDMTPQQIRLMVEAHEFAMGFRLQQLIAPLLEGLTEGKATYEQAGSPRRRTGRMSTRNSGGGVDYHPYEAPPEMQEAALRSGFAGLGIPIHKKGE